MRRVGQPQQTTPVKVLGDLAERMRKQEFRVDRIALRFNKDNEGGYLYAQINDDFDLDLLPDPLAVGGTWGAAIEEASGSGLLIGSTSELLLKAVDLLTLQVVSGDLRLQASNAVEANAPLFEFFTPGCTLRLLETGETFFSGNDFASWRFAGWELDTSDGAIFVLTATSTSFEIQNHTGGRIFKVDENGDVHIKTGHTVVADL